MRDIWIVVGLGYGDEGKGSIVDYLARKTETSLVVRYNGGAQATHNVITPEGRHHTFAQFGSGSFIPGSATLLSRYMLINPLSLRLEGRHLEEIGVERVWKKLFIDERATIITPWQVSANRLRETLRGQNKHGTCGQGIGETVSDKLSGLYMSVGDTRMPYEDLKNFLKEIRDHKHAQLMAEFNLQLPGNDDEDYLNLITRKYKEFEERCNLVDEDDIRTLLAIPEQIIFEGSQGVLLDQDHGWAPHTTWSKTTTENAEEMVEEYIKSEDNVIKLGVTRAYLTRHGAGPFPTETGEENNFEDHNTENDWQEHFRIGAFDHISFEYALKATGNVDFLAVTCIDHVGTGPQNVCFSYYVNELIISEMNPLPRGSDSSERTKIIFAAQPLFEQFPDISSFLNYLNSIVPLHITSAGATANDKIEIDMSAYVHVQ